MKKSDSQFALCWSKKLKAIHILGGSCKRCGEKLPFLLDFHHVGEKTFSMNDMESRRWSIIENEIKKCELLCGNCHAELHYKNSRNGIIIEQFMLNNKFYNCSICGYKGENYASLEFHHVDKDKKMFTINNALLRKIKVSVQELNDEISKCIVVCRNCHRKKHFDLEKFNLLLPQIESKTKGYKELRPKIDRDKVREMLDKGLKQIEIARFFNASKGTISDIVKSMC